MKSILTLAAVLLLAPGLAAWAQQETVTTALAYSGPAPPTEVLAEDNPNDRGYAILVSWKSSVDDTLGAVTGYTIWRRQADADSAKIKDWLRVGSRAAAGAPGTEVSFVDVDDQAMENGGLYRYRVDAEGSGGAASSAYFQDGASPRAQWFDMGLFAMLGAVLIISGAIIYWILRGQGGKDIYLRPVAGLKAFDEAIGRATEMGQPVLFVPGIMDMDQIETLAGVSVMGYVGKMTARYETPLEVPVSRSLVMAHSREVLRESYLSEGRPDLYKEDMVHYLTDDQFAYAAAVDGIMLREKPAACFYQGKFYAESLILAETGNSIGAIQIAGTASPAQLPFFITACDYTLIGEEFFAASAYLSKDSKQIGSIRGQDVGKLIFMTALALGLIQIILTSAGVELPAWLEVSRLFEVSGG